MRIEVDTGMLQGTAGRGSGIAAQVWSALSQLAMVGASAGAADAVDVEEALSACCQNWSAALGGLAQDVEGLTRNLGAEASAYTTTDSEAMGGGR